MSKISNFLSKSKEKVKKARNAITVGLGTVALSTSTAYAALGDGLNADTTMKNIIGQVLNIVRYVGVLLLVWAVIQLVLAFKNEDGDSKSRAAMMVGIALVLIGMKSVLQAIGLAI